MKHTLLVIAGAALGGLLGYFAFFWIIQQGYYGMILPGGLLGLGAGFGRSRSVAVPIACGLAALGLGLFTEWRYKPFEEDPGFTYLIAHVSELDRVTLLMIAVGGAIGFWVPFRRMD